MAAIQYTRFPNLLAIEHDHGHDDFTPQQTLKLQGSETDLLRAWAELLSAYSGNDDQVSFVFNEEVATVSLADGNIRKIRRRQGGDDGIPRNATAIYTHNDLEDQQRLALELHIDSPSQEAALRSDGCVPGSHLREVRAVFASILHTHATGASRWTPWRDATSRLSILNENPAQMQGPRLLHELIALSMASSTNAIEYYDEHGECTSISYRDLDLKVASLVKVLRRRLRRSKPNRRKVIPILAPQSPSLYIAMIAILRCGYAFCPLQLDAPKERLEFITKDVDAQLIVTLSKLADRLVSIPGVDVLLLDEASRAGSEEARNDSGTPELLESSSTAYIMYTSGSTGKPKGVPVSHRAATQSLLAHDRHVPKFSRFLQFAAPTFDVSMFEIFFTLFRSSTLIVCERSTLLNDLPRAMQDMRVDAAELTPTVAGGLLRSRRNAPDLKLLLTIGEMLTPQVVAEFGGNGSRASILWGMYGPTEAAIHCTLQREFSSQHRPGNIGVPLDTVSAFIVPPSAPDSPDGAISDVLPLGFVGELAVGGHQLADGYLNRVQQSSQVFVETQEHGVLYRTGDKARMLCDGSIECLGRIVSGQVKLRGQRIELGEVRHAVARTPGCIDAVISIVDDTMVAFCLGGPQLQAADILESCKRWLPAFMVPSDVVLSTELPRLSSGKVDVNALAQSYKSGKMNMSRPGDTSLDSQTREVLEELEKILLCPVDVDAPLDTIGLDSLSAIKVASRLRARSLQVAMTDLLSDRSVRQLMRNKKFRRKRIESEQQEQKQSLAFPEARQLAERSHSSSNVQSSEIIFPCTPLQLAMLVETQKDFSAYCNWIEIEIRAGLDLERVKEMFQHLATSHSMLRSGFLQTDSTSHPFVCVTHAQLDESQFFKVASFNHEYSLHETDLTRPLKMQARFEESQTSLLLQIHHSLYDGWSMDILLRDMQLWLDGKHIATTGHFTEVSRFYMDVDGTAAMDYWQDQFADFAPSSLPDFHGRTPENSAIEVESLTLGVDLDRIQQMATDITVSKPVFFQTALAYVLGGYLGTSDVMIGTATSGRSIPVSSIDEIFGPCLATCPLRIQFEHTRTIFELLKHVHQLNRSMIEHAVIPPHVIRQVCDLPNNRPLWDVLFVWQESLESRTAANRDVCIKGSEDRLESALTVEFEPKDGRIIAKATFRSGLLPRAQVVILLRQIDELVARFLEDRSSTISDITRGLSAGVLSIVNPSPDQIHFDRGLGFAVEQHALHQPNSPALVLAEDIAKEHATTQSLTYQQLNDRANQLAHLLRDRNPRSVELIVIIMDKTLDLYSAILAVLKLGLGYLPITPTTPLKRIKTIIDQAGSQIVLSHRAISNALALDSLGCELLSLDTVDMSQLSKDNIDVPYDGSKPAYAVFTSGSTGTPKGVLVTQQNLLSNLAVLREIYPCEQNDRLLQACSQAFDVSVFEIFFTWQEGMCLCSGSNDVLFKDLEMAIRVLGVTHLSLTPTVAALVNPEMVPRVKFLVTAGEGVTEKVKVQWSGRGLFQGYGPSETTNICTVKPKVTAEDSIRNIGHPFRNTSAFVIDPSTTTILPKGAVGELCFGGDQVFRGYLNQPELTKNKFIDHPGFGRLYRSGDTGRILSDGTITFAARLDDQVKIRGQRVELHEINHCILLQPQVVDCATLVMEVLSKMAGLVSFIVLRNLKSMQSKASDTLLPPLDSSLKALLQHLSKSLKESLPPYMIPSAIIPIRAVPMTMQGKIDSRRLKSELDAIPETDLMYLLDQEEDHEDETSMSQREHIILAALRETIQVPLPSVSRNTSFLSLGLDSISAIAFARKASQSLREDVPVSAVLRNPSIGRLSQFLDNRSVATSTVSPMDAVLTTELVDYAHSKAKQAGIDVVRVLPCTPLQEAMLASSSGDTGMYHNTTSFRISGDVSKLRTCWEVMFERHEILRTTFISTETTLHPYLQLVLRRVELPWLDLTGSSEAIEPPLPSPITCSRPPVQITVHRSQRAVYLRFSCHHALYDGTSMKLLIQEVEALYNNKALPQPPVATAFWQQVIEHREASHVEFWANCLEDFRPTILRADHHTQERVSSNCAHPLHSVETSCQQISSSLLSVCQVAWARTLAVLFNDEDACFGNVVSGRSDLPEHLDELLLPTFNTLPFRLDLKKHVRCNDSLKAAQRQNAAGIAHQFCPLRMIQSRLGFAETGLFSSLLLLQTSPLDPDVGIWNIEHEYGTMDFPLILEVIPDRRKDTLSLTLYYNTSALHASAAQEILRLFLEAFTGVLDIQESFQHIRQRVPHGILDDILRRTVRPKSSKIKSGDKLSLDSKSETEEHICNIIAELTGVKSKQVSPAASIHQVGIDSIGAIQLASKLRKLHFKHTTAAMVLRHPIIRDLAELLDQNIDTASAPAPAFDLQKYSDKYMPIIREALGLDADDIEHVWPCTSIQMGMLSRFLRDGTTYVNHVTFQTTAQVDAAAVIRAWTSVTVDFEMLRTGFSSVDEAEFPYAMVVYSPGRHDPPVLCELRPDFDLESWREQNTTDFQKNTSRPPWAVCVQPAGNGLLMHLSILHALYDATSLAMVLSAVSSELLRHEHERPAAVAPIVSQLLALGRSSSSNGMAHEKFWNDQLAEAAFNAFPDLTPLHVVETSTRQVKLELHANFISIEEQCASHGFTLQSVGQAAWAQLLAAYLGESSVCFGVVWSGRDGFADADKAAFPCLVTLPFGVNLKDKSGADVVRLAMSFNSAARQFQFSSLANIRRWTKKDVLFDTIFAYQKFISGHSPNMFEAMDEISTDEFSVSLELEPNSKGGLTAILTFKDSILPQEQARILLRQYAATFVDILQHSGTAVLNVSHNEDRLLSILPAKHESLESPVELLHEFVERQAILAPDKTAFEFFNRGADGSLFSQKWTYRELNAEGDRVACHLGDNDIRPGSSVGICFDKCPEASFAILGTLKAGCAYVAIDPTAPTARKDFIIRDSQIVMLLSAHRTTGSLDHLDITAPIVYLDEPLKMSNASKAFRRPARISPDDACYCLYTSGTTGTPKGCELTHRNAVQAMRAFSILFSGRWNADSKWLQFASFHFDVSVLEQYWSWSEGICVVSAPRDLIFEDLEHTIQVMGITHIDLTPSLASLVQPENVPKLCKGVFITGGEQLKQEILDVWGEFEAIHNGYGPTETTIGVTMYTQVPKVGKPANIGKQFANVGTYVLQPNTFTPVVRGGVGELCIAGPLVGKGYLNRPHLTAEKFPMVEAFNERIYRTGDLVRLCHDETFLFLGRIDDQIKLRGQRLEIGEINSTIRRAVPDMSDVATYVLRHPRQQNDQLVTFFATAEASNASTESAISASSRTSDLIAQGRAACLDKLPGYMIPTFFIPLNRMPLSPNNKTDAKALKQLFCEASVEMLQSLPANKDSVMNKKEKRIAEIISGVSGIPTTAISVSSNIFELGLDSISVLALNNKLKAAGFTGVSVSQIMSNPVLRGLAEAMQSNSAVAHQSVSVALQKIAVFRKKHISLARMTFEDHADEVEDVVPCTPLQEGMISQSLGISPSSYFSKFDFELSKNVDPEEMQDAWQQTCDRLEILRTWFMQTEDGYAQVLLRKLQLPFIRECVDLEAQLVERMESAYHSWYEARSVHLERPFEVRFWRTNSKTIMTLNMFHGLYDGNCLGRLLEEVKASYNRKPLQKSGPSFREALPHGPLLELDDAKAFWLSHFKPSLGTHLHLTGPPSQCSTTLHTQERFERCRRLLNVTHQVLVQAAWLVTLMRLYNATSVSTGVVCSGRAIEFPRVDEIIGPMFNTIPFSAALGNDRATWSSFAQQCHTDNVEALPFQHTPLRDIQKWCQSSLGSKAFETLFVFQMANDVVGDAFNNDLWTSREQRTSTEFALAFDVEYKSDGSLQMMLASRAAEIDGNDLESILAMLTDDLSSIINAPKETINLGVTSNVEPPLRQQQKEQIKLNGFSAYHWTPDTTVIRAEVSRLSGVPEQEITENISIFELGLDSIDAIKLSARLAKQALHIPVSSIMKAATIFEMSKRIVQNDSSAASCEFLNRAVTKLNGYFKKSTKFDLDTGCILPATPLQEAMVRGMVESGYDQYFNHDVLRIAGSVDLSRLQAAWQLVYNNTPILRAGFVEVDDPTIRSTYAQLIGKHQHLPWSSTWREVPLDVRDILQSKKQAARTQPPGSSHFQLHLVYNAEERYLILSMPHAMYDGYSLALIHNDVHQAYHAGHLLRRPDCEHILESIMSTQQSSNASEFWAAQLSGVTPCIIERTHNAQQTSNNPSNSIRAQLTSRISAATIKNLCKQQAVTPQTLGQCCFALVLATYLRRLDLVYGLVLSGRDTEDAQSLIFPTMNTIPFRTALEGTKSQFLRSTQQAMANIREHQHFPLSRAQMFSANPGQRLFNSLFIFQSKPDNGSDSNKLYESVSSLADVDVPVCVEMELEDDALLWRTACHNDFFDAADQEQLLRRLELALKHLLWDSQAHVIDFDGHEAAIGSLPQFIVEQNPKQLSNGYHNSHKRQLEHLSSDAKLIFEIIAHVAQVPVKEISPYTTLYHLGLDSISAIKICSLLKKRGIIISVGSLLRAPNLLEITTAVVKQTGNGEIISSSENADVHAVNTTQVQTLQNGLGETSLFEEWSPATAGQIYMLQQWKQSSGRLFFDTFYFELSSAVMTRNDIRNAVAQWVRRFPMLRTTFLYTGDGNMPVVQQVFRADSVQVSHESFCDHSADDTISGRYVIHFAQQENVVSTVFPVTVSCIHLQNRTWSIGVKIHHALYDGVSLPSLLANLESLLLHTKQSSGTSDISTFMKFATSAFVAANRPSTREFWTRYLAGVQSKAHPESLSRQIVHRRRMAQYRPHFIDDAQSIVAAARSHGVTVSALFMSIYARVISKIKGITAQTQQEKDKVVLGAYIANRSHGNQGLTAFPTVNLLPVLVDVSLPLFEAASKIQRDLLEISEEPNVAASLWQIKQWTGVTIDTFINWLQLPELEEESTGQLHDRFRVQGEMDQIVDEDVEGFELPESFKTDKLCEAYLPTIDVEVALRGGGLDLGIFGPCSLLAREQVEEIFSCIRSTLQAATDT